MYTELEFIWNTYTCKYNAVSLRMSKLMVLRVHKRFAKEIPIRHDLWCSYLNNPGIISKMMCTLYNIHKKNYFIYQGCSYDHVFCKLVLRPDYTTWFLF